MRWQLRIMAVCFAYRKLKFKQSNLTFVPVPFTISVWLWHTSVLGKQSLTGLHHVCCHTTGLLRTIFNLIFKLHPGYPQSFSKLVQQRQAYAASKAIHVW